MKRSEFINSVTLRLIEEKALLENRCMIVGIEGQGCSGKSIFTSELKKALKEKGQACESVSIDDFCNKRGIRYSGDEPAHKQHYYKNFDYDKFEIEILKEASDKGKLDYCDFVLDTGTDKYSKKLDLSVSLDAILLVEGVFIFKNEFKKYYDFGMMLTIDTAEQLRRATDRDYKKNGNAEAVLKKYESRYLPAYALYEKINMPYEFVNLVVDNANFTEPKIVKGDLKGEII